MDLNELKDKVSKTLVILAESGNELGDLDQALGDGDLGITVTAGSNAIVSAIESSEAQTVGALLIEMGKAFAGGNPSTFAALVGASLMTGGKETRENTICDRQCASVVAASAVETISKRGKTKQGDKTILDGLIPLAEVLSDESISDEEALAIAISRVSTAVEATKALRSQKGRAAWLQERSVGLQDPGITALLRFLEAWAV